MDENKTTTLQVWQTIQSIAPVAQASRMFGVTIEQAAIVMLTGYELGLGLAAAFKFIHVIDGKPSLSPQGALALIQKSKELDGLKITDGPDYCECWMKRKSGFEYIARFTMDDANRAGLVKDKSGWSKYPSNMLRWRAIGYCADIVFPDITGGLDAPEELGAAVDQSGEPIKSNFEISKPPTVARQQEEKDNAPDIAGLIAMFPIERVLAANSGVLPGTQAQVETIVSRLAEEDRIAALKSDSPTAVEP